MKLGRPGGFWWGLGLFAATSACGSNEGGGSAPERGVGRTSSALTSASDAGVGGGYDASLGAGDEASANAASACTSSHTPEIAPDQDDYFAPATVHLNATGLECGAAYSVRITTPNELWPQVVPSTTVDLAAQTVDATGAVTFSYALTTDVNGNFEVELLDAAGDVVATTDFHDSHFRYGHVSWTQSGPPSSRTAIFTVTDGWRRSYPWQCYTTAGAATACHGSDGKAAIGDIIGPGPTFSFGDGAAPVTLYYVVTAVDLTADWVIGRGIATPADAAKQTITHIYPGAGPYLANVDGCCRLTTLSNSSNGNFHVGATVRFDVADSSPVSSQAPIVDAPANATDFHFSLPTVDSDGDVVSCRLATCAEAYDATSCAFPPLMTVHPDCTVHWNTVGLTVGNVYTTQIHIGTTRNGAPMDEVAVDFLLQIVAADANPPQCALDQLSPAPTSSTASSAVWKIPAGSPLGFRVRGTDADPGDTVSINSSGAPAGATLAPALPIAGASPQTTTFAWTPALSDIGTSASVTFTVSDQVGQQAQCGVTVQVESPCPDGTACSDGNPCTQQDICVNNACVGTPVVCTAGDQCHAAGTCNPATGACTNPVLPDGTACNDGNACSQTDTCQAGVCTGASPVVCHASDQCHVAGTCDPSSGACSNPVASDGTACNDGNACTQTDSCQSGTCAGANPVLCVAADQCHVAGTCDPSSGVCSNPAAPDGAACNDGNACTQTDACLSGACAGANPVQCTAADQCHVAGSCDPSSGTCSNPAAPDGTACSDANACTQTDTCQSGGCAGANPVVCGAEDACHLAGSCDPASGTCSNPSAPPRLDPGTDQTVVGSCSSAPVGFASPGVANGCTATVTCTPVAGNSYGTHAVTCTAQGANGAVSAPVSFTVTVLEPLTVKVQSPLSGDNDSADNVVKSGSTVPTKIRLYACGTDVTATASVVAKVGVAYAPAGGVPVAYHGAGDPGGVMVFDGAAYHYNLNTNGYGVTVGTGTFYELDVTVAYTSAPGVTVGSDAIKLDTK